MYGRARRSYGYGRRPRSPQQSAPRLPVGGRSRRRRSPRRGAWRVMLLVLGLLSCLVVAASFVWYHERSAESATLMALDRPASAEPPEPPVPPARVRAVEELDEQLRGISQSHTGTAGIVVEDHYSGESASLNADRLFVAASLSKLYALLTLYRAAATCELSLDDEITMRPSDV